MATNTPNKPIHLVIENRLYDLTKFAKTHPGGSLILENFHNCDTTDYFYALHSDAARRMLKNMPSTPLPEEDRVPESDYLKLQDKFEKEGLFKSDFRVEVLQLFHVLGFVFLAFYWRYEYPFLATIAVAAASLLSGWIGHMWEHSRNNSLAKWSAYFTPLVAGLSGSWWSTKHNRHHVSTNEIDHDRDIRLMPYIFLWKPNKEKEAWNRGIQHIYFAALYSILNIKWQIDSFIWSIQNSQRRELILFIIHWILKVAFIPWQIWVTAVLLSGTVLAWVVTASHQAETKLGDKRELLQGKAQSKYQIQDFITHQVTTSRDIATQSWFLNYICGGMQHQIEHHIFPRMPLYKLPLIKPLMKEYCEKKGLDFLEDGFWDIMKRNYSNIETLAKIKLDE